VIVTNEVTIDRVIVNTRRELRRLTFSPAFDEMVNATVVKLISKYLSSGQTIKDVRTLSADFSGSQLKVLFEIVLEEVCDRGCVTQLTNSTLANSVEKFITDAL
jgi:hypothetical protein